MPVSLGSAATPAPASTHAVQKTCRSLANELTRQDDWYTNLINPVLYSQAEIDERLEIYSALHTCLENLSEPLSGDLQTIHTLTKYFLIFAGGWQTPPGGSELILVDLAEATDPAIWQIRDEADLPPPPGYVFVRTYDSRQSMPPPIQAIFADPQVAGVTIYTRYIAVLDERQPSLQQELLRRQALPATVSHELIHAYVHSSMALEDLGRLPKWYNEGLAIYFSGSGENHTLMTPNSLLVQTTTAEYLLYKQNFDYLESRLGRERLLELVRRSIQERQPELLYQELEIENERYLEMLARGWRERQVRRAQAVSLAAVLLLGTAVLWMVPSGITCSSCGYHDHKKAFQRGSCPRCRRPIDITHEQVHRQFRRPFQVCQVCGRRYWLWKAGQVRRQRAGTTIWVDQEAGSALPEPVLKTVGAICDDCQQRSRQLAQEHQQKQQAELELSRQKAAALYSAWLRRTPQVEVWFQTGLEIETFEAALERCTRAALAARFQPPLLPAPDFELRQFPGRENDFLLEAPAGYENVLLRRVWLDGEKRLLYGTVRAFPDGRIGFSWVLSDLSW